MSRLGSYRTFESYAGPGFAWSLKLLSDDFFDLGGPGTNAMALVIVSVVTLLLPCFMDAAGFMLSALSSQIESAHFNATFYGMQQWSSLRREISNRRSFICSTRFQSSAPVYLIASEISLSNPSSSSRSGQGSAAAAMYPEIPVALLADLYPRGNRRSTFRMHWAVVIRGTTYELVREDGSTRTRLMVSPPGFVSRVTAAGIPLQLAWVEELGKTYLRDEEILALAVHAISERQNYNPLTKNCQLLWADELLPRIICQCPDQPHLKAPIELQDWSGRLLFLMVFAGVAASVIALLRDLGILPLSVQLCSKSNKWGYLCTEISKYWVLFRSVQQTLLEYLRHSKVSSPFLDSPEMRQLVKDGFIGDVAYDAHIRMVYAQLQEGKRDPVIVKRFSEFRDELVSLTRFYVVCVFLSTGLSFLHRIYAYPLFQVAELSLSIIVTRKVWRASTLVGLPGFPPLRNCTAQIWKGPDVVDPILSKDEQKILDFLSMPGQLDSFFKSNPKEPLPKHQAGQD